MPDIKQLEPLVGEWSVEVPKFEIADARMSFEWTLGGAFLLQRSSAPDPVPDGLCVIAADRDGDGFTQHYFDSRGVVRVYAMQFDGRTWTLERHAPDFTPLDFHQRFVGTLDGDVIEGRFEIGPDAESLELDFEATYRRL